MTSVIYREWLKSLDRTMRNQQRNILLLLDNCTAHKADGLELTNIRIHMLPPNTTSKIQPMDAGIIAAFKRRYRRLQLAHALDLDEAGRTDIYKVDLVQAMRWSKRSWSEILPESISNCWRHTGLLGGTPSSLEADPPEGDVNKDLEEIIQQLRVRNPMPLESILNPLHENEVSESLNDDDMIAQSTSAPSDETDENPTANADVPQISMEEKLSAVRTVLQLLEDVEELHYTTLKDIRKLQSRLRQENGKKPLKDTTIDQYFNIVRVLPSSWGSTQR